MNILVTGGLGYIGSHTIVELQEDRHNVVVVDNLCNSHIDVIRDINNITNKQCIFYQIDIRDYINLEKVIKKYQFDCCIHFAGLKSVTESIKNSLDYYDNNVLGTLTLLKLLNKYNCKNIIFSSSATVYGKPLSVPVKEENPRGMCTNPYGQTKCMIEQILIDLQKASIDWNIILLRYFNPIGAHPSGLIGENPKGIPNNLMPYITQVAIGKRKELNIFGKDYETPDGTGIRDYIHVVDLAKGHVKALSVIDKKCGLKIYNLGTGKGYSVLEIIDTFERVNNIKIRYKIKPRRKGDVDICYADVSKAEKELGWKAKYGIEEMCRSSWIWQKNNFNKIKL